MNDILIVDDDLDQLRLLAKAISARGKQMNVQTAADGVEAIRVLGERDIDLVLTDLQLPEMNGFDLLAWILSNRPHVAVFTMTAFYDDDAVARLDELGEIECFVKPLDVAAIYQRLADELADGVRGKIRNISLASLLQLVQMERKTCTMSVESEGRIGHLFIREGAIVHARWAGGEGEQAAIQIASWPFPSITIASVCRSSRRTVDRRMDFIVMEAMRLLDETVRDSAEGPAFELDEIEGWDPEVSAHQPAPDRSLSAFPAPPPAEAEAIILMESSGRIRNCVGRLENLEAVAGFVASVYRTKVETVERLGLNDDIEELVITGRKHWAIARPLEGDRDQLVVGVFDPKVANLAMERFELDGYVAAMRAWAEGEDVP